MSELSLQCIYDYAQECDITSALAERVDWNDSEKLIAQCKEIPEVVLKNLPQISSILNYCESNDDWDSGDVANFYGEICRELSDTGFATHKNKVSSSLAEVINLIRLKSGLGDVEAASLTMSDENQKSLAEITAKLDGNDFITGGVIQSTVELIDDIRECSDNSDDFTDSLELMVTNKTDVLHIN